MVLIFKILVFPQEFYTAQKHLLKNIVGVMARFYIVQGDAVNHVGVPADDFIHF